MKPARGQATTELALGSLVFVVVLLFGIYFGEVPFMMLKVKEAANFAVTKATGQRTHSFSASNIAAATTFRPFDPRAAADATRARYRDFDGMSDRTGGSFAAVMTKASGFQVECVPDRRMSFQVDRDRFISTKRNNATGRADYNATFNYLERRYRDRGGVSCSVSADVVPFHIPTSFLDQGAGKMSEEQLTKRTFKVCGAGRPSGNGTTCKGELAVLTGDWGFDAPTVNSINGDVDTVQDNQVTNDAYAGFVERLYTLNGESQGNAGRHLLEVVAGVKPSDKEYLNESIFNMSFGGDQGARDDVVVKPFVVDPNQPRLRYQTSGADMNSKYVKWTEANGKATGVPTCFLGLHGCEP